MLQRAEGLDAHQLSAIAGLEDRTVATDGGRLKLEWGALRHRPSSEVNDLLWWEGDELVGFCGRYQFGAGTPEVTGMVAPHRRGRGTGGRLLDEMLALCAERGDHRVLLVAPRSSIAARRLAERHGAPLDHSEHALVLTELRNHAPGDASLSLRLASSPEDFAAVGRLRRAGFGNDHSGDDEPTLVAERGDRIVATLRVTNDADGGRGVYGFVVEPALQGRGLGREILRRVCEEALSEGAPSVHLEVEVDNDRALGLYTSTGFELQSTEDYYAFSPIPRGAARQEAGPPGS